MAAALTSIPGLFVEGGVSGSAPGISAGVYAWMRARGIMVVTDPTFAGGAVGDGVHDDTAAITAMETARAAVNGLGYFPSENPAGNPAVYLVNSSLVTTGPINWQGDATSTSKGPVIRAGTSMRCVLSIQSTFGAPLGHPDPPGASVKGLIIDGNNLVTRCCVLGIGTYESQFENLYAINSRGDGFAMLGRNLPLIVSAITFGGGAPTGVTITQPDPNSGWGSNLQAPGVYNWVVKTTAGAVGTATYALSQDGGATYATATQVVQQTSNLCVTSGAVYQYPSGLQLHFPPGYVAAAGGTLAFSVTIQPEDAGSSVALNTNVHYLNCGADSCGVNFETTGSTAAGNFPGDCAQTFVGGTVALTSGSQIMQGTGTPFLSTINAREGDMTSVAGVAYPIACVLDDFQTAIAIGSVPSVTISGQDYSVAVGAGYFEDGGTENNSAVCIGYRSARNARGKRIGGLHGTKAFSGTITDSTFHIGILVGSSQLVTESSTFISPDLEGQSTVYVQGSVLACIFLGFSHLTPFPLGPGPAIVNLGSAFVGLNGANTAIETNTEIQVRTALTISAASQQIAAPDIGVDVGNGHTSYVDLTSTAQFTLTATPTIASPVPSIPVKRRLRNVGAFPISFQSNILASTGLILEAPIVTLGLLDEIEFTWYPASTVWIQEGLAHYGASIAGNKGRGSNVVTTTTAAVTSIYEFDLINATVSTGTSITANIYAQNSAGLNYAAWLGVKVSWNTNNPTPVLCGFTVDSVQGSAGGAPPFGWDISVTTGFPFGNINVIGDASHTVEWRIDVLCASAPNF